MIGIIGAMQVEIEGLVEKIKKPKTKTIGGLMFVSGSIGDSKVVIIKCGIGKVNAGAATSIMVTTFKEIKLVINLGVAGGIGEGLYQGDFVVADCSIQHDFDLTVEGLRPGQLAEYDSREFKSCSLAVKKMQAVLDGLEFRYKTGIIVSGDQFIANNEKVEWLKVEFNALACDMETSAIAQVCKAFNMPFLAVRSVSDGATDEAYLDFAQFVIVAAERSIKAVEEFLMGSNT